MKRHISTVLSRIESLEPRLCLSNNIAEVPPIAVSISTTVSTVVAPSDTLDALFAMPLTGPPLARGYSGTFRIAGQVDGAINWGIELGTSSAFTGWMLIDAGNLGGTVRYTGAAHGSQVKLNWSGDVSPLQGHFLGHLTHDGTTLRGVLVIHDSFTPAHLRRHTVMSAR